MNSVRAKILFFAIVVAAAWGLSACGGGVECGDNTKKKDGECVSISNLECGGGTTKKDGKCVLGETGCEAGTQYDSESGTCVASPDICDAESTMFDSSTNSCVGIVECGANTTEEDGTCKPAVDTLCGGSSGAVQFDSQSGRCKIAAAACGDGATLDPMSGTCKPAEGQCGKGKTWDDDQSKCVENKELCEKGTHFKDGVCMPDDFCQMGDIVFNGKCVKPAEKLAANADLTESENNDPSYGGSPNQLTVKMAGKDSVFKGTIDKPKDNNMDGIDEQDWDVYSFSAKAGDWFQISVQSIGAPQPHMIVKGPNGWMRSSTDGLETIAARQMVAPTDGDYEIWVAPASVALQDNVGPVGNQDWDYVGALKKMNMPSPSTIDMTSKNASGNFMKLTDNLFKVQGFSGGDVLQVTPEKAGSEVAGVATIWKDSSTQIATLELEPGETVTYEVPNTSSGDFLMHLDWVGAKGTDDAFEIAATKITDIEDIGTVKKDGTSTSSKHTVNAGQTYYYKFSAKAGQVIAVGQSNKNGRRLDLTLTSNGQELLDWEGFDALNDGQAKAAYWYSDTATSYQVKVTPSDPAVTLEELTLGVKSSTPTDLGQKQPGDTIKHTESDKLSDNRSEFYKVDFQSDVGLSGTVDKTKDRDDATFWIYDSDYEPQYRNNEAAQDIELDTVPISKGVKLIRFEANDGVDKYEFDLSVEAGPATESEPNDSPGRASRVKSKKTNVGTVSPGDVDYWRIDLRNKLGSDEILTAEVEGPFKGNSWNCEFIDGSTQKTVKKLSERDRGCTVLLGGLKKGTHFLGVSLEGTDSGTYSLKVQRAKGQLESEPNNSSGKANTLDYSKWSMGYPAYGEVPTRSETDFFEFTPSSALGKKERLVVGFENIGQSLEDLEIEVQDGSNNSVGSATGMQNALVASGLSNSKYYLKVSDGHQSRDNQYRVFAEKFSYDKSTQVTLKPQNGYFPDDDPKGMTSTVTAPTCGTVNDVIVSVDVGHRDWKDIRMELTNPGGTKVVLKTSPGDIDSADGETFTEVIPTSYSPANALTPFNGSTGTGKWKLKVADVQPDSGFFEGGKGGVLNSWTLYLKCQ